MIRRRSRSPRSVGDAAHHITEECERLFCETLKTVFLVEKDTGLQDSLVMDVPSATSNGHSRGANDNIKSNHVNKPTAAKAIPSAPTLIKHRLPTPAPSPDGYMFPESHGLIRDYVEMWDYVGGTRFRGFVAERDDGERCMFVFFDREVIGKDLKPG